MYLGSISSLRNIWLNITEIFCLHIFISILSNRHKYASKILTNSTIILEQQNSKKRLQILEAQHIRNKSTNFNKNNLETGADLLKFLLLVLPYIELILIKRYTSMNKTMYCSLQYPPPPQIYIYI